METYELLKVLIKRYPNNYELGAAVRNTYPAITKGGMKHAVREVIKKNFQPS